MTRSRKITLFVPTLASGGAERVTLNLSSALTNMGHKVTILVQRKTGALLPDVPTNVTFVSLDCKRSLGSVFSLTRYMKRENPDIFIANLCHANIVSLWAKALSFSSAYLIVCQHNMLSAEIKAHKIWQYKILPFLYRVFLPWADDIVAVSQTVADDLTQSVALAANKITTIYNPIINPDFSRKLQMPNTHAWFGKNTPPVILGVGRLTESKDFAMLIRAFALARKQRDLRLVILGEGPLKDDLQKLIDGLGITDCVQLLGFQANPLPFMREAALVALTSHYEGLSNVLIEALACGTNVISTSCPGGHIEVLDHGRYGLLVPVGDVDSMATAILQTLDYPKNKDILSKRGHEFTLDRAAQAYARLFDAA